MPFDASLKTAAVRVETYLQDTLPPPDNQIAEAMRYAVLNGGKRLRAFLVYESAALFDVDGADPVAAAIECMHAYSLVHDDLRRGQPTVHVKWDEATAVLVGDGLQAHALGYLAGAGHLDLLRRLAEACGVNGMVGGQALDIAAESAETPLTLNEITALQAKKTGALIRWSAEAGAVMAWKDPTPLGTYADALGLAFQIQDDILDVIGDSSATGKRLRKDEAAGKATFVSLLGLAEAKTRAVELIDAAIDALEPYGEKAENLREVARYTITRAT